MATARDLITSAMRLSGILAQGETPSAQEATDALDSLNDILDGWKTENLMLYANDAEQFTLVQNQQLYTIGTGGNFDTTRPVVLEGAYVTYNNLDYQLRILNTEQWNEIALKNYSAPIPNAIYYIPEYPLGKIKIWPAPSLAIPLTLTMNMQFSTLTLDTVLSFPPGYKKALRAVLACNLLPEYGMPVPAQVAEMARSMVGNLKAANRQQPVSQFDPALTGRGGVGLAGFLGGYF